MECILCEYEVESPDRRFFLDNHVHDPILMHEACAREEGIAYTSQDPADPIKYDLVVNCPVCGKQEMHPDS